jgi:hypothetical protein
MSIKSVMVALVLAGTSTAAMAHPVYVDNDGDNDADDYPAQLPPAAQPPVAQPPYAQPPYAQPPYAQPPVYNQGPVTLGTQLRFGYNERAYLPVNTGNRLRNITITANSGRVYVRKVVVQFANGQEQTLNGLHRNLTAGESFTLDLEGGARRVARVVVFGRDLNLNPWQNQVGWRRPVNFYRVLSTFSVTGC